MSESLDYQYTVQGIRNTNDCFYQNPCISTTPKHRTEIESSSKNLHQELSDLITELVALKLFVVDQIHLVRKNNNATPISEDLVNL